MQTTGAIAFSQSTGANGTAWNWVNSYDANSKALANCSQPDCQVVAWVSNGCAAFSDRQRQRIWMGMEQRFGQCRKQCGFSVCDAYFQLPYSGVGLQRLIRALWSMIKRKPFTPNAGELG